MIKQLNWRNIAGKFIACLRDERGAVMAEYLIVSGVTIPLACYLFHPDNGFYQAARDQYNLTALFLTFPGP
jgi:hypothetical protein